MARALRVLLVGHAGELRFFERPGIYTEPGTVAGYDNYRLTTDANDPNDLTDGKLGERPDTTPDLEKEDPPISGHLQLAVQDSAGVPLGKSTLPRSTS